MVLALRYAAGSARLERGIAYKNLALARVAGQCWRLRLRPLSGRLSGISSVRQTLGAVLLAGTVAVG